MKDVIESLEEWNHAEMLGDPCPEFFATLKQEATLTTGFFYKAKDRRNTQDGQWHSETKTWEQWFSGNKDQGWGLTWHFENPKKVGSVMVYAATVEKARTAKSVEKIYAMALDFDSGTKLDDIIDRILELGLFASVTTSHTHGKAAMEIPRDEVVKALGAAENFTDDQIQTFLREYSKQHYDADFISSAQVSEQRRRTRNGIQIVVSTAPLDKFRVVLPLKKPVSMESLGDTDRAALDCFEAKYIGLAVDMLKGTPDVSTTDPCRMMYNPRHPKGSEWYSAVVRGRPLTFEEIPTRNKSEYVKGRSGTGSAYTAAGGGKLLTPSGVNLMARWHDIKDRLMIADLIEIECPDKLRDDPGKQGWVHIECPFEHEHGTINKNDTATFMVNALDSSSENFAGGCHHDACKSQDRGALELLQAMLTEGWFDEDLLDDDSSYMMDPGEEVVDPADAGQESASADEFELFDSWAPHGYKRLGGKIKRMPSNSQIAAHEADCEAAKESGKPEPKAPEPEAICGVFDVVGRSSNADGTEAAGRILSFEGENKKRVEVTLSLAEIRSDPKAIFDILSDRGLWLPVGNIAKINLQMFLNGMMPKRQIATVNTPGWVRDEHGDIAGFMLPTGVYDRISGVPLRLLEGSRIEVVKPKGTLANQITAYKAALTHADTNFYWPLGVAAAFSGPLLGILEWPPSGFSLSGMTSKGKTLAQVLGVSAYGSPEPGKGLLFSGNGTGNSFEDLGMRGTDTLLAVDEIAAMGDKKALGSMLFALSTGRTKSRKSGRGRGLTEGDNFRPFLLTSSEKGMRNEIQAVGEAYRGGLAVRFPDTDVSDGVTVGAVALAELEAVRSNYGHVGPAYIHHLITTGVINDRAGLERDVLAIAAKLAEGMGAAMTRAARTFAITLRGGELAAEAGLLGDAGEAKTAIETAVQKAWDTFVQSDEAGAANGGDALLDKLRSFLFGQLNKRIVVMDDQVEVSDDHGKTYHDVLGWADRDTIYLDSSKLDDPSVLGLDIGSRNEMVKQFDKLGVLIRPEGKGATFRQLPKALAVGSGNGAAVRNIRLCRKTLGI